LGNPEDFYQNLQLNFQILEVRRGRENALGENIPLRLERIFAPRTTPASRQGTEVFCQNIPDESAPVFHKLGSFGSAWESWP